MANKLELYIIIPEVVVNQFTDPSFEAASADEWTADGGATLSVDTATARRGKQSLKIVSASADGGAASIVTLTAGLAYTFAADILTVLGSVYTAGFADTADYQSGKTATLTGDGGWQRITVTATAAADTTRVILRSNTAETWYVDGVLLVQSAHPQLYFDGDYAARSPVNGRQFDFRWLGTRYASASERSGYTRRGGYMLKLSDYCRVLAVTGLGLTAIANAVLPLAMGGALYQNTTPLPREVNLSVSFFGADWETYSAKVATVQQALSQLTPTSQPVRILAQVEDEQGRVQSEPVVFDAVYQGGLEGSLSSPTQYRTTIRLSLPDPVLLAESQTVQALTATDTIAVKGLLARDAAGDWSNLGGLFDEGELGPSIDAILATDDFLYVGGWFVECDDDTDVRWAARMKWDDVGVWNPLKTGLYLGARVRTLIEYGGEVYLGGDFTNVGGNASWDYLVKYDPVTEAYSAVLTTPPNGAVRSLYYDGTYIYIAGDFTSIDGVTTRGIARHNPATGVTTAMGSGAGSGAVYDVTGYSIGRTRYVIASGTFANMGGVAAADYIAAWNGVAWVSIGTPNDNVYQARDIGGRLFAVGAYTTIDGVTYNRIAYYTGSTWVALGTGLDAAAYSVALDEAGYVWVMGTFTTAGGVAILDKLALWTGSSWLPAPLDMPSSPYSTGNPMFYHAPSGYFLLGNKANGNAVLPGATIRNTAATVYPTVRVEGSGTLLLIENYTTGEAIRFDGNGLPIATSETIEVICDRGGVKIISSIRGDISHYVQPGSSATIHLAPGENTLNVYASGGATAVLLGQMAYDSLEQTLR